jgi:hypothetical protein
MQDRDIGLGDVANREDANYIIKLDGNAAEPRFGHAMQALWRDAGVLAAFARSHEFQVRSHGSV